MGTPSQLLHPAATVVVVRDGERPGGTSVLETLMLRRNDHGTFGGMWVFPGGRVDEDDVDPTTPDDDMAAGRRAAAREALEEAGLVLDPGGDGRPVALAAAVERPEGLRHLVLRRRPGPTPTSQVDGAEIHEHAWLAPVEVLRRRDAGLVSLAPPTFVTLTLLAEHATVAEPARRAAHRQPGAVPHPDRSRRRRPTPRSGTATSRTRRSQGRRTAGTAC